MPNKAARDCAVERTPCRRSDDVLSGLPPMTVAETATSPNDALRPQTKPANGVVPGRSHSVNFEGFTPAPSTRLEGEDGLETVQPSDSRKQLEMYNSLTSISFSQQRLVHFPRWEETTSGTQGSTVRQPEELGDRVAESYFKALVDSGRLQTESLKSIELCDASYASWTKARPHSWSSRWNKDSDREDSGEHFRITCDNYGAMMLRFLDRLPLIEGLTIHSAVISYPLPFKEFAQLKFISLWAKEIDREIVEEICASLKNLEALQVAGSFHLDGELLKDLQSLKNLNELFMANATIDGDGFKELLKSKAEIVLQNCMILVPKPQNTGGIVFVDCMFLNQA